MKKLYSFAILIFIILFSNSNYANYMLVQNVSITGNNSGASTVQVQFDISWENSWLDQINWDAGWVFVKYKNSNGEWHHCTINSNGYVNGTGTNSEIEISNDNVGAFIKRANTNSGNFDCDGVQLQWDYGADGLSNITGLEVRVFAIEMVYIPEGDFNVSPKLVINGSSRIFAAPGGNAPVINTRLSPTLIYQTATDSLIVRIKGDAGIDTDLDGIVDNTTYPTGYSSFYCYKYELTEQQYSDFYNTLTQQQQTTLGIAGTNISLINGEYVSTTPNKACKTGTNSNIQILAYGDWSGVRPMTILEYNKASFGPEYLVGNNVSSTGNYSWNSQSSSATSETFTQENGQESFSFTGYNYNNQNNNGGYIYRAGIFSDGVNSNTSNPREYAGASYYGVMELSGNVTEPTVKLEELNFTNLSGNGELNSSGDADVSQWNTNMLQQTESKTYLFNGFRYVRSAGGVSCPMPYANDSVNSVITWTPGGSETQWLVEYGEAGFSLGSGTQVTVSTNSYTIPSNPNIGTYNFYVKAICNSTDNSVFVGPIVHIKCPTPSNLYSDSIVKWTPGGIETQWLVEYGQAGFSLGSGTQVTVSTNSYTIPSNPNIGTYNVYVKAICNSTDNSGFVGPISFISNSSIVGCGLTATTGCSNTPTFNTVGINNGSNIGTAFPSPFGNYYKSVKEQYLFTAAELNLAGVVPGDKITEIAWETISQNGATSTFNNYTIKMGCTIENQITNWVGGLSTVFGPQNYNVALGSNDFQLTNAYEWNGISNLIVEICYENISNGTNYTKNWSTPYTITPFNSSLNSKNDSNNMCPSPNPPTVSNNRPVTKFKTCN